ncbi:hypothetical protein KSP39_PZI015948 [Platanthera zijinensis]|uniref:Uncharacterized protein n=1 Tax=Platanthera zijinensis TaxID=2320716 RepID=A0AAP0B8H2_9ASPA
MLKQKSLRESIFGIVDKDGNSTLQLAAGSAGNSHPWSISGADCMGEQTVIVCKELHWAKLLQTTQHEGADCMGDIHKNTAQKNA